MLSHPPKDSGIYSGRRREREFTIFSFLKTEVSVSGGIRRFLKNDGDCFAAILVYKGENDSDSHHFADDNVFLYLQRVFVKVLSLNEGVDKNARKGWFFQNEHLFFELEKRTSCPSLAAGHLLFGAKGPAEFLCGRVKNFALAFLKERDAAKLCIPATGDAVSHRTKRKCCFIDSL